MTKKVIAMTLTVLLIIALLIMAARAITGATPGEWYADAVAWAYENGITVGTSSNTFEPDRGITRAEMVTMLWRMNGSPEPKSGHPFVDVPVVTPTPEPTPTATPKPEMPKPPKIEHVIHEEFALDYYGRMYIGEDYSVGLYDTMSQTLVDMTDAAFIAKFQDGCYMVGDHDSEGLWVIRWLDPGDTMRIERKNGTVEHYILLRTDRHVSNIGYDVVDADGNSCIYTGDHDLMISTCNDSTGVDMTATFWVRVDGSGRQRTAVVEAAPDYNIPVCGRVK